MPTTFAFKSRGHGMPYGAPHDVAYKVHIDIPVMIANQPLDSDIPAAGFGAGDVLQIFEVPAGFLLQHVGVRVTTVEGGAACTGDIGGATATQTNLAEDTGVGYMGTIDLQSKTTQTVLITDTDLGATNVMGIVYITDGTIDFTFVTAATAVAVFDVWAAGWKVF